MITSKQCLAKFGPPENNKSMVLLNVPDELEIGVIPKKIYCNKYLVDALILALNNIINRGLIGELRTWDGCFNIRQKRGATSMSIHSWGLAVDINAAWNAFGKKPTMSKALVQCFVDAGFDWGGYWTKPDGMHFQLASLP